MAISSYKAYLMKGTGSGSSVTWSKLIDIKEFPDLGGAPEMLETTTTSDAMQTYIPGIQQLDALEFKCNYDATDYETLKAMEGTSTQFAVFFGGTTTATATDGMFSWTGKLSVYVNGGGVNEVVEMTISIAPSTEITKLSSNS